MLRRRHFEKAQTSREAEGRQETDEAGWHRRDPARSVPRCSQGGLAVLARYQAFRQRRRAVREGALLVREAKRGLRRYGYRLTADGKAQLEEAVAGFEQSRKGARDRAGQDALIEAVNTV